MRTIWSRDDFVVKATTAVTTDATDIMNAVCYTQGLGDDVQVLATPRIATSSGCTTERWRAMVNYPGFYWGDCEGSTYDPRERPWFVSGATGPKDVIIVIDKSGSMRYNNRMEYAREGATSGRQLAHQHRLRERRHSEPSDSYNTVLVPAEYAYRQTLVNNIASITGGIRRRLHEGDDQGVRDPAKSRDALPHGQLLARVRLSDGWRSDRDCRNRSSDEWEAEILGNKREHDMFFIVALGEGGLSRGGGSTASRASRARSTACSSRSLTTTSRR